MLYFISIAVMSLFAFDIVHKEDLEEHKGILINVSLLLSLGFIVYYYESTMLLIYYTIIVFLSFMFRLMYLNVNKLYSLIPIAIIILVTFFASVKYSDITSTINVINPFANNDYTKELNMINNHKDLIDSLNNEVVKLETTISKNSMKLDSLNKIINESNYNESADFLRDFLKIK